MKLKRILSALAAAAVMVSACAFPSYAEGETAAFCFDTDASLSSWETYGSVTETGLKLSISNDIKETGDGSLCISENVSAGDINNENSYGGAYVSAETLGLSSFSGCTVEMSVYIDKDAAALTDSFTIFSDGIVWLASSVPSENAGKWTTVSLTIPENADNTRIGFEIPVFTSYSGNAAYIDNIIIRDVNGSTVANVGDEKVSASSIDVSIGTGARIALLVVLVVIILAVIGGIGFVVSSLLKRFT